MKKKVLFFIESLQCGGAEKSLISLLPILDYTRMDVELMLMKRRGIFEQYVPEHVQIFDFKQQVHPLLFLLYKTIFSLRLRWNRLIGNKEHGAETRWKTMHRAYTPLKKHYDVAIAYQQGFPTYYIIDKVFADKKCTWINADITQVGYKAPFNRPFYEKADVIVPVSELLNDILSASGYVPKEKLLPIYDIVNPALIRSMAQEQPTTLLNDGLIIMTVGRMVHLKGHDLAIEAARILRDRGLSYTWYLIGDGEERTHIENLIKNYNLDNVKLLGEQANPYPYMNACDIYVQTSRFEGFGLTIAEAKILHKPVVSTNFPVVHDQITNGVNGLIADKNPHSMAEQILRLTSDPELRESIVRHLKQEQNTTAEKESVKVNKLILNP